MGVAGSLGVVFSEWSYEFGISIGTASMVVAIVPLLVGLLSKYNKVNQIRFVKQCQEDYMDSVSKTKRAFMEALPLLSYLISTYFVRIY